MVDEEEAGDGDDDVEDLGSRGAAGLLGSRLLSPPPLLWMRRRRMGVDCKDAKEVPREVGGCPGGGRRGQAGVDDPRALALGE